MTAQEKEELGEAIQFIDDRAIDLMLCALALNEILEGPEEVNKAYGGRPVRKVNKNWEDAADLITEVQKSAKYCIDGLISLKCDIAYHIKRPTTSDDEVSQEPPAVDGSKLTPEEKGIMSNIRPGTLEAVRRINEALPGVKPHIRKDGIIEISL